MRVFFIDVPAATPTIFIFCTIRAQWWRRQTGWDIARRNMRILNPVKNKIRMKGWLNNRRGLDPRLFQWSSKLFFNIVLSVVAVNYEIRRQGWLENRGNLNPRNFDHLYFLPGIGSQPGCLTRDTSKLVILSS